MPRQVRKPRNIDEVLSGQLQSRVSVLNMPVPPGVTIYVTDSHCGRYRVNAQTVTVPVWAYNATPAKTHGDPNYAIYYVAHELAHAWADHDGNDPNDHNDDFYEWFKKLCPPELWHYELEYKTRGARRAGITDSPILNAAGNTTYGRATTADTEGGLYESVTGHRSKVIDASPADLKRAAVKRDPRLKKLLAGLRDDEVKSYITGWFKRQSAAQ